MRIVIAGASGRMGQTLIEAVLDADDATLVAALAPPGDRALGRDAGALFGRETAVPISADIDAALAGADVLIDFTRPGGTLEHVRRACAHGVKMVIGTTGFSADEKGVIERAGEQIGIVFAPNMSVGVNVTFKLLEVAARLLSKGYDIEISEAHHRHKVDAPSGTAIKMGEIVANALGRDLREVAVFGREGVTGERDPSTIGFSVVRGGDIVGDHTVLFAGVGERVEITHKSASRRSYAQGSLIAARFLLDKPAGLFDMQDVLGLC